MKDYQHALYLLKLGASSNTSFFYAQDQLLYTISKSNDNLDLVVARVAEVVKKYGTSHSSSQLLLKIMDICLDQKPDLRCHCSSKNPHYCALSQAFKFIKFEILPKTNRQSYQNDPSFFYLQKKICFV